MHFWKIKTLFSLFILIRSRNVSDHFDLPYIYIYIYIYIVTVGKLNHG